MTEYFIAFRTIVNKNILFRGDGLHQKFHQIKFNVSMLK